MYRGDFALGKTFDFKFTTVDTYGVPATLSSSPVVSIYPDNSTTEITAGITLSVDFDSRTGLNNVRVVATSGNGYATATNYQAVITTGTVASLSVVGYVVAEFSIENRSALRPTTADRTLDVSAGGEAGLDWANIGSPTTAQNLSATNIDVDQVVASVSGNVTGSVGSVAAGGITAASIATDAIDADALAADAVAEIADGVWDEAIAGHLSAGSTGAALNSASSAGDPWSTALPGAYGAGTAGFIVGTNLDGTVTSRLAPTVAGRTLDVSVGGEAGLDWANIGSPTTAQNLSATNIDVDQIVASVTGAVGSVTGNVGGNVTGSVGSIATGGIAAASFAAGAIDAASIATDAITAAKIAANAITSSELDATAVTEIQSSILSDATPFAGANVDATISSRATPAQVNSEVVDALNVDTYAQPGQATPAATTTIRLMVAYLYKAWRNRTTQTATEYDLYNDDAATVDQKAAFSDDGTTADRGEIATGP